MQLDPYATPLTQLLTLLCSYTGYTPLHYILQRLALSIFSEVIRAACFSDLLDEHNRALISLVALDVIVNCCNDDHPSEDHRRPIEVIHSRWGRLRPERPKLLKYFQLPCNVFSKNTM